jgi:hypothetical protein
VAAREYSESGMSAPKRDRVKGKVLPRESERKRVKEKRSRKKVSYHPVSCFLSLSLSLSHFHSVEASASCSTADVI